MNCLPVQLKTGRVLVVGDGHAARAKARLFDQLGIVFDWWKTHPGEAGLAAASQRQGHPTSRYVLVVIAEQSEYGSAIHSWAGSQRLLCNLIDQPEKSDVYIPAIIERGPLRIGIGTGGINPVLARLVRTSIELALPTSLAQLAVIAKRWNERVRHALPNLRQRRRFWERLLTGNLADRMAAGTLALSGEQDSLMQAQLAIACQADQPGQVLVVGAGPGDPGLLTLKGLRAIQQADVILHDALVSPHILALARRDARLVDVGKRQGKPGHSQTHICDEMIDLARRGQQVCRLKGGDPLVFARGGEEIAALRQAGIDFALIPGICSANGIAAALGLPLTHRQLAHSLRFVTGHSLHSKWQQLSVDQETLVVFMGFTQLPRLAEQLLANGAAPHTPLLLAQNATLPNQQLLRTTLAQAARAAHQLRLEDGPVLLIIGEVVALANTPDGLVDYQSPDWISPQSKVIEYAS